MNNKDLINSIENLRKKINKEAIPYCNERIEFIINNKIESPDEIEKILDSLLDYIGVGCGIDEFKKLNSYYTTIHKKNSECYNQSYNELYGEGVGYL